MLVVRKVEVACGVGDQRPSRQSGDRQRLNHAGVEGRQRAQPNARNKVSSEPRKTLGWKAPAELFLPEGIFDFLQHWSAKITPVALAP